MLHGWAGVNVDSFRGDYVGESWDFECIAPGRKDQRNRVGAPATESRVSKPPHLKGFSLQVPHPGPCSKSRPSASCRSTQRRATSPQGAASALVSEDAAVLHLFQTPLDRASGLTGLETHGSHRWQHEGFPESIAFLVECPVPLL